MRTFKFERILSVTLQKSSFITTAGFDVDKYKDNFLKSMGRQEINIYFSSKVAPWIREQWGSSVQNAEKGGVILTLFSETLEYPSRLVLSFVPHARPLSPPAFITKVLRDSNEIVTLYQTKPPSQPDL